MNWTNLIPLPFMETWQLVLATIATVALFSKTGRWIWKRTRPLADGMSTDARKRDEKRKVRPLLPPRQKPKFKPRPGSKTCIVKVTGLKHATGLRLFIAGIDPDGRHREIENAIIPKKAHHLDVPIHEHERALVKIRGEGWAPFHIESDEPGSFACTWRGVRDTANTVRERMREVSMPRPPSSVWANRDQLHEAYSKAMDHYTNKADMSEPVPEWVKDAYCKLARNSPTVQDCAEKFATGGEIPNSNTLTFPTFLAPGETLIPLSRDKDGTLGVVASNMPYVKFHEEGRINSPTIGQLAPGSYISERFLKPTVFNLNKDVKLREIRPSRKRLKRTVTDISQSTVKEAVKKVIDNQLKSNVEKLAEARREIEQQKKSNAAPFDAFGICIKEAAKAFEGLGQAMGLLHKDDDDK